MFTFNHIMKKFGKIVWQDLTVEHAEEIKNFYCDVIGWESSDVNQGDYNDFNIHTSSDDHEVIAGICYKKGKIKNFPSQWLNYVTVEDLSSSLEKCLKLQGKIIEGPTLMGKSKVAIIQDPAGAYLALIEDLIEE